MTEILRIIRLYETTRDIRLKLSDILPHTHSDVSSQGSELITIYAQHSLSRHDVKRGVAPKPDDVDYYAVGEAKIRLLSENETELRHSLLDILGLPRSSGENIIP